MNTLIESKLVLLISEAVFTARRLEAKGEAGPVFVP
jgi:hypothetical protein